METPTEKFTQSLTFKGIIIFVLILILLIPGTMIQNLIKERQERSRETVQKINDKWSSSQTLCAPLLLIPYTTTTYDNNKKPYHEEHTLYITPKELNIYIRPSFLKSGTTAFTKLFYTKATSNLKGIFHNSTI